MVKTLFATLGAIALGALAFYCAQRHAPGLEAKLSSNVQAGLSNRSMEWATPKLNGRDLTLEGEAPNPELRERAAEIARAQPGVRSIDNRLTIAPPPRPRPAAPAGVSPKSYPTRITYDGSALTLDGLAPNPSSKDALVAKAATQFGAQRVDDRLQIAPGATTSWVPAVSAMVDSMSHVERGAAVIIGNRLHVFGKAASEDAAAQVVAIIDDALSGEQQATYDVDVLNPLPPPPEPPAVTPYPTVVRADATGVSLSGLAPSATAREAAVRRAHAHFSAERVQNHLAIVPGSSPAWSDAIGAILDGLHVLDDGYVELVDSEVHISGHASTADAKDRATQIIEAALPEEYRANFVIRTPERAPAVEAAEKISAVEPAEEISPSECQQQINETLSSQQILFELASARLTADSAALLDTLALVAERCPSTRIEIAGHTDAQGTRENNQRLSQERADAVREHLIQAGLDPERLVALGYGETQPIAENETAEGAAKNRRIEFTIY